MCTVARNMVNVSVNLSSRINFVCVRSLDTGGKRFKIITFLISSQDTLFKKIFPIFSEI